MARIPAEEIERLKREIPVERLIAARGIALERHGADLRGLCPFHEDREPSLVVTPGKNLWHCLGACRTGGSVIDWVMKASGVSFRHAVELLRGGDASSLAAEAARTARKLEAPFVADAEDGQVLADVAAYYHETLKESPEALRYMESRGLQHPEMIGRFKIGFANRTLGYRLPPRNRKAGAELRGRLERLGILREESGHEHFNGSIVIPVFDASGGVAGMYGRKITPNLREGTPRHLYLPGPHKGVWNEDALKASKEIILCEALIDALTFWSAGFQNVTSSYGVNGFTDDHRQAFEKHGVRRVWIAYDRDEAGDSAAERLKEELSTLGIESHRVLFPKGMDANEYAQKVTPPAQSLAVLLNSAEWWGKHPADAPEPDEPPQPSTEPTAEPPSAPLNAAPAVISLAAGPKLETHGNELVMWQGDRKYRIRGFEPHSMETMKVNLLVSRQTEFHADTFDMNLDRGRAAFIKRAAEELNLNEDIVRKDVGRLFLALERRQAEAAQASVTEKPEIRMTDEERSEAMAFLNDPKLLDRIVADLGRCGLVGEETNKLAGYIAAVSRHLESPLAVLVQSSSASGKSSLMDAVLNLVPEEARIQYSAMTGQSLYYMGEMDLKHKILAVVEEEGASRAAYALKLLQSEGSLAIAAAGKDAATGKLVTHEYRVEGPVMLFLTTTAPDVDEELLNRCLVLSVNEDRSQTQAIHRLQREQQTLEGLLGRAERERIVRIHRNAQRLLQPVTVVNPWARDLTFPDTMTRSRRDQMKYLSLIRAIALLHQYQRPVRQVTHAGNAIAYIEATVDDIAVANRLAEEILGRSLDELQPQTRRLLELMDEAVHRECGKLEIERTDFRFSRKDVRAWTAWGDSALKRHLGRLEDLEYLAVHRGGRGQSFVYELVWMAGADPAKPRFAGLIPVYDLKKSGVNGEKSAPRHGHVTGVSHPGSGRQPLVNTAPERKPVRVNENAY